MTKRFLTGKTFLIGLLIANFVLLSCNAMDQDPNPVETHPEQTKIRPFPMGSETVYQIIAPDENLIRLDGSDVGLKQNYRYEWIQDEYLGVANPDLAGYFRQNVDDDGKIKATCGFGAAFVAYNLATLLSYDPKTSKDDLCQAFYNDRLRNKFAGWPRPALDAENNVYKFDSNKFKEFFKWAIPIVVDYRRDRGLPAADLYNHDLTPDEIKDLVAKSYPVIQNLEDKIVSIVIDYDPDNQFKKDVLKNKIKAVIEDPDGKKFTIFICLNFFNDGYHWVAIIIRKNAANKLEVLYSDTANWKLDSFKVPMFHVIGLIEELQGSETFEAWLKKLSVDIEDVIFTAKNMKGIPQIEAFYMEYVKANDKDVRDLYDKYVTDENKKTKPVVKPLEKWLNEENLENWFTENLVKIIKTPILPKVEQFLLRFKSALYEYFSKPKCKNCKSQMAEPIPLPCGMQFAKKGTEVKRKRDYDHCFVCRACLVDKMFDSTKRIGGTEYFYSWQCPDLKCKGYVAYEFKKLIEDEGEEFFDSVRLACAMYYGKNKEEQEQRGALFLDKFMPKGIDRGVLIEAARIYLDPLKDMQKQIRPELRLCGLAMVLVRPLFVRRLEELQDREHLDLPDLDIEWIRSHLINLILNAPIGDFPTGTNAETLTLRLLELGAKPKDIIAKLCDWADKITSFKLYEFINSNQGEIFKKIREDLEKILNADIKYAIESEQRHGEKAELEEKKTLVLNELDTNARSSEFKDALQQIIASPELKRKVEELGRFPAGEVGGKYTEAQIKEVVTWPTLKWEKATKEQLGKVLADTVELLKRPGDDEVQIKNSLDLIIQKFCELNKSNQYSDEAFATLKGMGVTIDAFDRSLPDSMSDDRKELLKERFVKVQPASPLKKNLQKLATQLGALKTKLKNLQGKLTLLRGKLTQKRRIK